MPNVANFLVQRLKETGVGHVFGNPDEYNVDFHKALKKTDGIEPVRTTDESHAGIAADAYARVNGSGCVCVSHNVGALKVANAVACACAERSPVVVISGMPGVKEKSLLPRYEVFENITCASAILNDATKAGYEIDRVLEALKYHKQPVYIELPRDVAKEPITYDVYSQGTPDSPKTDKQSLEEALEEVVSWVSKSENPVILAGVQLARYRLNDELTKFSKKYGIPVATTPLSKSVVSESHPLSLGVYCGKMSQDYVRTTVEESDCLLMLGVILTELPLDFLKMKLDKNQGVSCSIASLRVKNHNYADVCFHDFVKALFKADLGTVSYRSRKKNAQLEVACDPGNPVTADLLFSRINSLLDEHKVVVADVGDSLFGSLNMVTQHAYGFISPAYYGNVGFSIPGALGVQLAQPDYRPIVLVGDGAFQMCCRELGIIAALNLNPIVFVLNNQGCAGHRVRTKEDFYDIPAWNYDAVSHMIPGVDGKAVRLGVELDAAIKEAMASDKPFVINVIVDKEDISLTMKRMIKDA